MDADTLSLALQQKSAALAARELAVTRRTIYRWCKALNIRRRQYGCPDADLLRHLERSCILQKEIARQFGVSRWTIWRWCRTLGIAHHTTGRFSTGTKGNVPSIHEEMPFGIGIAFEHEDEPWEF
jgi:DNA invertase Pin-like site-specific DNA recombinase